MKQDEKDKANGGIDQGKLNLIRESLLQQGEKPDPMDYFLKPDQFDFDRFNKDMREYNNSIPAQ